MERLPLDALAKYTYLSGLNFNVAGTYGAYVAHTAQMEDNSYHSDIWLFNPEDLDQPPKQLTTSGKASSFEWLPDGDRLIYPSIKDMAVKTSIENGEPLTVYYALSIHGGESQEWMRIPLKVSQITPISDTLYLLSAGYHPEWDRFNEADAAVRPGILKEWKEALNYEVIEEIPFWTNGGTYLRGVRNRLYAYCNQDKVLLPLTDEDTDVQSWHYEATLDRLVAITKQFRGKAPLESALQIADGMVALLHEVDFANASKEALKSALKCVYPAEKHAIRYAYSLDRETLVLLANDGSTHGLNQNSTFYTLTNKSDLAPFAPEFKGSVGNTVGSDARFGGKRNIKSHQGTLYFITTENESAYLNVMNMSGEIKRLTTLKGSVDDFTISTSANPKVAINAMRGNGLAEIYLLNAENEVQITHHNDWVFEKYHLSTPEEISIDRGGDASGNPFTIEGWVLKPLELKDEASKKYKGRAILNIHGGPKTVYGTVFYHEMQYWSNLGYYVLFCNPRGSDGKGDDFADIRGKYGSIDYEDIMAFVDEVLQKYPDIDPKALYVTGGSYGGFMTNWIVGHTNRFRAAAAQRSISNWTTEYGVTDIGYYFVPDQMGATPFSDYEALWNMSPLKYAENIETPLLLEHSDQDYRCWLPEALQMFTALKDQGKEARIIITKGENHELSRSGKPKSRIRRIQEITDWFDRW